MSDGKLGSTQEGAEEDLSNALQSQDFSIISALPIPVAVVGPDMVLTAASGAWCALFRLEQATLAGRCLYDALPWLPLSLRECHQQAMEGGAPDCEETCFTPPDGEPTWLRWRFAPIMATKDGTAGLALLAEDITGEKAMEHRLMRSERRLQVATEVARIGIFERNFETGETYLSPSMQDLLKTEKPPATFEEWLDLVVPEDRAATAEARAMALNPGEDGLYEISYHPVVEGDRKTMEIRGKTTFSGEGGDRRLRRTIGVLQDRTESSHLAAALARSQRLETVGRMAGMIAHDFNNLLTVILSNLELAGTLTANDALQNYLEQAIEATKLGASFNQRLLALAGARRPKPATFALDEHLAETWNIVSRVLNEDVHTRLLPGAPGSYVTANTGEFDAALLNLIVNSRDAVGKGGRIDVASGIVSLTPEQAAKHQNGKPGEFVWVSVSDTGQGMTPSVRALAMEPFFTTKTAERGSGLGLTSVAVMAARASGFVSIRSTPGEGTQVTLYLPRAENPQLEPREVKEPPTQFGDGERVLVVEDDPMVRESVLERLEALGYAVLEAGNAERALALLEEGEEVDLVFSDIVLPGDMSGYDLLAALQQDHPSVATLLTTGHMSRQYFETTPLLRPTEVLQKPYTMASLAAAVAQSLRTRPPFPSPHR